MTQRTPEWFEARLGRVTASRIVDVLGTEAKRRQYAAQLALERLYGVPQGTAYMSAAMAAGIDREEQVRRVYAFQRGIKVEEADFVPHPSIAMAGASPDGYVGTDGLIEIKCPDPANYLDALRGEKPDKKYMLQVQFQLACTRRKWADLVTYREGCPLVTKRIERDENQIAAIESEILQLLKEVDRTVAEINGH